MNMKIDVVESRSIIESVDVLELNQRPYLTLCSGHGATGRARRPDNLPCSIMTARPTDPAYFVSGDGCGRSTPWELRPRSIRLYRLCTFERNTNRSFPMARGTVFIEHGSICLRLLSPLLDRADAFYFVAGTFAFSIRNLAYCFEFAWRKGRPGFTPPASAV